MLKIETTKPATGPEAEAALANIPALNESLKDATLEEVRALIRHEADNKRRQSTLARLVARFNTLEGQANSEELIAYLAKTAK